jgi:hypothetical protein
MDILQLKDEDFRRLVGIKRITFNKMLEILIEAYKIKKAKGGRKNKTTIETMLLMTLEYWREYRTYFSIGVRYGLSEGYSYKVIKWVEDVLNDRPEFKLPKIEKLKEIETIIVDGTEVQIQRPKKKR